MVKKQIEVCIIVNVASKGQDGGGLPLGLNNRNSRNILNSRINTRRIWPVIASGGVVCGMMSRHIQNSCCIGSLSVIRWIMR